MRHIIESQVKQGLRKFGIDISYVDDDNYAPEMYIHTLIGAIAIKNPFNIIQVGANDGKHNDPIYDFVKENKHDTNIILVEPIRTVIPYLQENYSYHPSSEIINKAISNKDCSSIRLYGVNQDYWSDIDAGYGENWPNYRIPTGVTTTNKQQLLRWISENVQSDTDPEVIIEEFNVEVVQPRSVINESQNIAGVQLLQVDAEGMDDRIVYSFFEQNIYPNIINIESKHLSKKRQQEYEQTIESNEYDIYKYTPNEILAIK